MIFTTQVFAIFFAIAFFLYLMFKRRTVRHILLLVASSVFYGWWDYHFLALMWGVILVAYGAAFLMHTRPIIKTFVVTIALVILLGVLGVFKYYNFFTQSLMAVASQSGWHLSGTTLRIILPVGISFYTFQAISYIIDVYRGDIPVQKNLINVALYISFFPQLVAGPIVRAVDFIPQLYKDIDVNADDIAIGLRAFTIGFIYKSVFADNLALFADPIFNDLGKFDNLSLICANFSFYAQIYFDFAGYSLMAIGLARMMGFHFTDNFNFPYQSTSITDFWRRWHISLSTWLRDYLYIPLGGNRKGRIKQYRNLIITMLLGGLWHGASWNFVIWGGLHGCAISLNKLIGGWKTLRHPWVNGLLLVFSWFITQFFVYLCWIPFRLPDFTQTLEVFSAVFGLRNDIALSRAPIPWALLLLPLMIDTLTSNKIARSLLMEKHLFIPKPLRIPLVCFILGLIFAFSLTLIPMNVKSFIYFQF